MRASLCATVLLASAALVSRGPAIGAQEPTSQTSGPAHRESTGALITGGLLGGFAGLYAGIAAGNAVDRAGGLDPSCRKCARWGAATGAGIGTAVGIGLGVHAFNDGRGRAGPVLLRTAATVGVFWAGSYAAYRLAPEGVDLLMTLGGIGTGIYTAIRTERATMTITLR